MLRHIFQQDQNSGQKATGDGYVCGEYWSRCKFLARPFSPLVPPQYLTIFQTNKQAIAFKHLWQLSKHLTVIYQSGVEDKVDPELLLALLNVTPEAELQREIRDIIDELDIILHIANQQKEMVTRFVKFAKQITESDLANQSDFARVLHEEMKEHHHANRSYVEDRAEQSKETVKLLEQQQSAFNVHSEDLLSEIQDRIDELSALKNSAESTAQNVRLHYGRSRHAHGPC